MLITSPSFTHKSSPPIYKRTPLPLKLGSAHTDPRQSDPPPTTTTTKTTAIFNPLALS